MKRPRAHKYPQTTKQHTEPLTLSILSKVLDAATIAGDQFTDGLLLTFPPTDSTALRQPSQEFVLLNRTFSTLRRLHTSTQSLALEEHWNDCPDPVGEAEVGELWRSIAFADMDVWKFTLMLGRIDRSYNFHRPLLGSTSPPAVVS